MRRRWQPTIEQPAPIPVEWKCGITIVLLASFLMSGFFDALMIQVLGFPEVDRQIRILIAGLFTGMAVLTAIAAYSRPRVLTHREKPAWELPLIIILTLIPFWGLIGLINQWPITYVAGDVFMLGIMPAIYFTLTRRPLDNPRPVFSWLYGLMVFNAVIGAALVFYHNVYMGNMHKMSVDSAIPPLFYIILKQSPGFLEFLLVPFFIAAGVVTSKRSTWAGIIIAIVLAIALRPGMRRPVRVALIALILAGGVWVTLQLEPNLGQHSRDLIERRWQETLVDLSGEEGSDLNLESGGRAGEIVGVIDTITHRNIPVDWISGLGLGAIVEARGGRTRHHIHSTPAAFLARTGIAGLALWLTFALLVLSDLIKRAFRVQDEWERIQFLFWTGLWISMLIFSIKSQAFWGSVAGGVQLAYLYHLINYSDMRATSKQAASARAPSPQTKLSMRRQYA